MNDSAAKKLKKEIDDLVAISNDVPRRACRAGHNPNDIEISTIANWVTRIGQVIRNIYPAGNQHLVNYEEALTDKNFYSIHSNHFAHIAALMGIITAVQHEFENGLLFDVRHVLQADIFADFLEMAEYLLKENYKDAAAVIIGSVLEDSLRKLADSNGIPVVSPSGKKFTLEPLNTELAKANVYDRLIQKQITSWGDLRNKAAHGHYGEYDKAQVEMMLLFVQKFCSDYLK